MQDQAAEIRSNTERTGHARRRPRPVCSATRQTSKRSHSPRQNIASQKRDDKRPQRRRAGQFNQNAAGPAIHLYVPRDALAGSLNILCCIAHGFRSLVEFHRRISFIVGHLNDTHAPCAFGHGLLLQRGWTLNHCGNFSFLPSRWRCTPASAIEGRAAYTARHEARGVESGRHFPNRSVCWRRCGRRGQHDIGRLRVPNLGSKDLDLFAPSTLKFRSKP